MGIFVEAYLSTGIKRIKGLSSNERPLVYHFQTTKKEKSKLFYLSINSLHDNR